MLRKNKTVIGSLSKKLFYGAMAVTLCGCGLRTRSLQDFLNDPFNEQTIVENARLRHPSSVIVCRSKQCAPSKLSMSREYIHNSLLHLFQNNSRKTAMVCEADPSTHACTENYIHQSKDGIIILACCFHQPALNNMSLICIGFYNFNGLRFIQNRRFNCRKLCY